METVLLVAAFVAIAGLYFLYYEPKKRIQKFASDAEKAGYKVKLMPFRFMNYYLMDLSMVDDSSFIEFKTQLPKYDIIVGNMLTNLAIIPISPEILKDMFNQLNKLEKNPFFSKVFQTLKGGGIPFTEGQVWKRKRRIISTVFHFDFLNTMIPAIEEEVEAQFKNIDKKIANKEEINLLTSFSKILSSVVAKCFFGTVANEYKVGDKYFCQFLLQTFNEMTLYCYELDNVVLGMSAYNYSLTPKARSLKKKVQLLYSIVREITEKQLEKIKNGEMKQTNMLTVFWEKGMLNEGNEQDPNKYTKDELMGEFIVFFGAGTDTTANSVNLMLHYLSEKPQYRDKIREQVNELQKENLITQERLKKMKWMEAVFNETLRIGGPAGGMLPRIAVDKVSAGGLQIPKGSSVDIFPIINDYKTEYFEKPFEFIPQRWIQNSNPKPYTFVPFGAGERNCIGQYLARIQAKIIIQRFVNRYNFKSKRPIKMRYDFVYATHGEFELQMIKNQQ